MISHAVHPRWFYTPRLHSFYSHLLLGGGKFLGCAGTRSADEEQSSVGQGDIAAIGSQSSVFRAEAVHFDLGAGKQGLLREARSYQRAWRSRLDGPILNAAVGLFDIDVDPGMGIDPRHLGHGSRQRHRIILIVFGRKRMMRVRSGAEGNHRHRDKHEHQVVSSFHRFRLQAVSPALTLLAVPLPLLPYLWFVLRTR